MDILVIFDEEIDTAHLLQKITKKPATLYLFPLTSNFLLIEKVERNLKAIPNIDIVFLKSAKEINHEVNLMQKTIHTWSHQLANYQIYRKNLKEWFLFPDQMGSAWWLGLLAEKNTVQDAVFFKIAQMNAVKNQLAKMRVDYCWLTLSDAQSRNILLKTAKAMQIKAFTIPPAMKVKQPFKKRIFRYISQNAIFAACLNLFIWLKDSLYARIHLAHRRKRILEAMKRGFTFVTYFPNIDEVAAKQGIFINKYASPLQKECKSANIPITWLAMPVYYNGHRFKSAVRLAKTFIECGENLFLLQEFFTLKIFCQSIWWWIKQSFLSEILLRSIPTKTLLANLTHKEVLPYVHYIWRHSFMGTSGIRGIIFYLTYKHFFTSIPSIKTCLYFCEMQAWEKALNMAKKQFSTDTRTYAFQHTVVMRNYFNYFYSEADLEQTSKNTDMPLPDILIANGNLPYQLFAASKYPNLRQAEAIRQLYLDKTIAGQNNIQKNKVLNHKHVLFIGGSCDQQETKSLITLVYAAFPRADTFAIWFKGSPVNPLLPLFAELGIDIAKTGYTICTEDVADLLADATIALIANTTVAIEAFAFGCEVVIPLFADTMLMNPIVETNAFYHLISSPLELKRIVDEKMFAKEQKSMNKEFITECWNIDPALHLWKELLTDAKTA